MKKKISIFVIGLLFLLSSCYIENKKPQENNPFHPIIYRESWMYLDGADWTDNLKHSNYGLVIAGSQNGVFMKIDEFKYNGYSINELRKNDTLDYIAQVETELVFPGNIFDIYNQNNKAGSIVCNHIEYSRRNPDEGADHLNMYFDKMPLVSSGKIIGICCDWNPMPRQANIYDDSIEVDINGNGIIDKISWKIENNSNESFLIISAIYNNHEYHFRKQGEYSIRNVSLISVMDLNGDGTLELLFSQTDIGSYVNIYQINDKGIEEVINYVIYSGP